RRCEAGGAEARDGLGGDQAQGSEGPPARAQPEAAVRQAVPGGERRVAARAALFGFAQGAGYAGAPGGDAPRPAGPQRGREEGGQDEGPGQAPRGSPQGGTDAQGALVPDGEIGHPRPQRARRLRTPWY